MSNLYLNSLNDSICHLKNELRYTLVKEYDFVFSDHFVQRCAERQFTTYEIYKIIKELCENYRYKFAEESDLIVRYRGSVISMNVHHDVFGSFRRIIFKTIFKENKKHFGRDMDKVVIIK